MANITTKLLTFFMLIASVPTYSECKRREGRWFRNTVTETVVEHQVVTTLIPSSCVKVDPTLPPCRLAKYMDMDIDSEFLGEQKRYEALIVPTRMAGDKAMEASTQGGYERQLEGSPSSSEIGWAEYLGLVAPTTTQTLIELHTETYLDPRYVITFSVKGCRPSKLPVENICPLGPTMTAMPEEVTPSSVIAPVANSDIKETAALEAVNNLTSAGLRRL